MVDGLKISAQRDPGSLLRELRVAASAAGHAIPVLREEHARPALRTVRPLPRDAIPVDLVELPLESRDALFLLRLGHHLPPFFFGASFFSAGFFSSLAGFFSSFAAGFSGFGSALASGFASGFGASALGGAAGFSAFSALGAGFSGFGAAAFFSLSSGSISLLRTRMCLRSTARASSFVL